MDARTRIANNIVYYRLQKNWSQEDLAEKMDASSAYISSLENARRNVRIDYVDKLADILEIDVTQLLEPREKLKNNKAKRKVYVR